MCNTNILTECVPLSTINYSHVANALSRLKTGLMEKGQLDVTLDLQYKHSASQAQPRNAGTT